MFTHVTLYCDNQGALALAKNPVHHQRSKHIDIKNHFIRAEVEKGMIQLKYIPSDQNVSDVFTKPVTGVKLKKFINLLMGTNVKFQYECKLVPPSV